MTFAADGSEINTFIDFTDKPLSFIDINFMSYTPVMDLTIERNMDMVGHENSLTLCEVVIFGGEFHLDNFLKLFVV